MKKLKNNIKNSLNSVCTITFLYLLTANQALAWFKPDQTYKSGRFDLSMNSQIYRTTANFDGNKSQQSLLNSNYYQIIDVNPQVRWAFAKDWGLRTGFNIGSAESSDIIATRKNSTFNRLDFGADYLLLDYSGFQTIIDVEYSYAADKIQTNTDTVLNSHGASEFKPTLLTRLSMDGFYPYGYLGLNYRSEGLSMLMTYGGGGEYRFSEMGIGFALNAFMTIKDDDKTSSALTRDLITTRVDGGSKKFYSVNPNLVNAELFFNFAATDSLFIKLFGNYDVYGSNISQGFAAGATFQYSFESGLEVNGAKKYNQENVHPSTQFIAPPLNKKPRTRSEVIVKPHESNTFQEDTNDGVNQDYFKPINPKKEEYVQPIEEIQPQNESVPDSSDTEVQKDLDQLGYSIKLKKKKK
jgi:hypothetical protein